MDLTESKLFGSRLLMMRIPSRVMRTEKRTKKLTGRAVTRKANLWFKLLRNRRQFLKAQGPKLCYLKS
jgi:hypothetical protein